MNEFDGFDEDQFDRLLRQIYDGRLDPENLPVELYKAILEVLTAGVGAGLAGAEVTENLGNIIQHFDRNIAVFSAAKTHQQVVDMSSKVFDSKGNKRSFNKFAEDAAEIFNEYNVNWLEAEFTTATNAGFAAQQWEDIQRDADVTEALQYVTAGDERVRAEHSDLDGITLPVDHSFWSTHFPPNGFRCRCDVIQLLDDDEFKITDESKLPKIDKTDLFAFNPAKDKYIFDESKHPYLKVDKRYSKLKENDFGLPLPDKPE